jgi:hypothetical protein
MTGQRSSVGMRSADLNRWSRSGIVFLQQSAQAATAPDEMDLHALRGRPDAVRDLPSGITRVVVQDHGRSLLRRQLPQGFHQVPKLRRLLVDLLGEGALKSSSVLELSRRHAKGDAPDPGEGVPELAASPEGLSERLGHGVLGHFLIAGEQGYSALDG